MRTRLPYLPETASQTSGPFVHIGLLPSTAGLVRGPGDLGREIAGPGARGTRIRVTGRVIDGAGAPVRDALIEVWQANADGRFAHPDGGGPVEDGFRGWGRTMTDFDTGIWTIDTVKPGPVPGPGGRMQAPHLSLWLVARGINTGLQTRLYFGDEEAANTADPVLALIDGPARRATLIATPDADPEAGSPMNYDFNIILQGPDETVFFDV